MARRQILGWPALGLVILLVSWQLIACTEVLSLLILPSPVEVARTFVDQITSSVIWEHARFTIANTRPVSSSVLGFFAEENLDVELLTAGDITEAALINQGDADVAFAGFAEVASGIVAGVEYDVVFDGYHLAAESIVAPPTARSRAWPTSKA